MNMEAQTSDSSIPTEFRHAYFDGKVAYENHIARELEKGKKGRHESWGWFQSGLRGHHGYFEEPTGRRNAQTFHGLGGYDAESLSHEVTELHDEGKKVLVADFFGQGVVGAELNADSTIATSLQNFPARDTRITQFNGDGLSVDVVDKCMEAIKEKKREGHEFHIAFFRPVGGQNSIDSLNVYVTTRMYQVLSQIYDALSPNGLLFFTSPHPQLTLYLQELFHTFQPSPLVRLDAYDSRCLLKKTPGVSLPSLRDIAHTHPDILRRMVSHAKK